MSRRGSVAQWPTYYDREPRDKQPSILVNVGGAWSVQLPSGETMPVSSHAAVLDLAVSRRLDLYVSDLGDAENGYPWLDAALDDPHTTACALPDRGLVGLRCRSGRYQVWIGAAKSWGYPVADLAFLADLTALFAHVGQGTATTPGALGQAVMRAEHKAAGWLKVSRPPGDCRRDLLAYGIGGRVDTPGLGVRTETAYEEDMRNAYAAAARLPLPVGTASRVPRGVDLTTSDLFATWFCRCTVYLPETLPISPILYRDGPTVHQANAAGWYGLPNQLPIWLWKHEADAARRAGAIVTTIGGWGWQQAEPMLQSWAERMHARRQDAPTVDVRNLVKMSIVSAIGRHGMHPVDYRLVAEAEADANAIPLLLGGRGPISSLYVQPLPDPDAASLTMWSSFIVSTVRLWIYQRMVEHQGAGNTVLASNYDAIILANPTTLPLDPEQLGGWRQQALSHVFIPQPRWLESDQKTRRPGVGVGTSAVEHAERISAHKQWVGKEFALSPTARYLRRTRGQAVAEEYLRNELGKGDPNTHEN